MAKTKYIKLDFCAKDKKKFKNTDFISPIQLEFELERVGNTNHYGVFYEKKFSVEKHISSFTKELKVLIYLMRRVRLEKQWES